VGYPGRQALAPGPGVAGVVTEMAVYLESPKDLSRNNISMEKCFSVHWLQWLTPLLSPHASMP